MYLLRDRGRTRALAERARDAGYAAIVASVDGGSVPHGHGGVGTRLVVPPSFRFPNLAPADAPHDPDLLRMVNDFDPSITFDDLGLFHEWSGLPMVVKGVMRGDDAAACVDAGASAVIVSNHGGRIVDGCIATADVLAEVVDAVAGRRGVRRRRHPHRCRRGARAVPRCSGGARRPARVVGARRRRRRRRARLCSTTCAELVRVAAFCGATNLAELTRDLVRTG